MRWPFLQLWKSNSRSSRWSRAKGTLPFLPISCIPFPIPFPSDFREFVIAPITAPMTVLAARIITVTVNPYLLKISFTLSKSGILFSLSAISVLSRSSFSSRSATLASAASLSEGKAFSSLVPEVVELFRAVESFFECVSFLFLGSNASSQLIDFFLWFLFLFLLLLYIIKLFLTRSKSSWRFFFQKFKSLQFAFTYMLLIKSINLGLGLFDIVSQILHLIIGSLTIGSNSFLLSKLFFGLS